MIEKKPIVYNTNKENTELLVKAIYDTKGLTPEERERALKLVDPNNYK